MLPVILMIAFVALVAALSWRYRDRPDIRCCHSGQWPPTDLTDPVATTAETPPADIEIPTPRQS